MCELEKRMYTVVIYTGSVWKKVMACLICFHFKEAKLCSSWDKWSLGWWKNLKYKDWYNGAIEFSLSIPSLLLAAGADQLGLFGSRVSHVCQHLWTNGLCVHYCQRSVCYRIFMAASAKQCCGRNLRTQNKTSAKHVTREESSHNELIPAGQTAYT